MNNHCNHISNMLKETLVIAWALDDFEHAEATCTVKCRGGKKATITASLEEPRPDTPQFSSKIVQTPPPCPKSIADDLGSITKNEWF